MPDWYNVASHVRRHAAERPDQAALKFPSKAYTAASPSWDALTYTQFESRSDAYAHGLSRQGVQRGDRVLMLMKPELDLWVVLFALFKIGAVPVIMDPGMGPKRLLACIERIGCRVVIAITPVHVIRTVVRKPFRAAELFITVGTKLWWGGPRLSECLDEGKGVFPLAQLGFDDPAAVAYTSGSTGTPKGVAYHQGMWDSAVASIRTMMDMKAGDVSVQAFAAFAIYDLCWGHTAVIPNFDLSKPAKADVAEFVRAIQAHDAKMAFASPIIWRKVAPYCVKAGLTLQSLDKAITTGAPTPPEMVAAYSKLLRPEVEFHTPYGATEAIPVSHIGSRELVDDCLAKTAKGAGTCVGRPAPGIDARIIAVTDGDLADWSSVVEVPQGEIGEIVVAGGQVSSAYLESPEGNASSKILHGDRVFHRMGDLGSFDGQGRIWFAGRKAHRLQTASGMLPCVPVEGIVNGHEKVFRSALVGVGEPGAQEPVLIVELHSGKSLSEADRTALIERTAGTPFDKVFSRILVHPGFPTDARHNSKIRREDLRTWAAQQ